MATFTLPKNSKIRDKGEVHTAPEGSGRVKKFKIYRYSPDSGENPHYDRFELDLRAARWFSTRCSRSRTRSIRR